MTQAENAETQVKRVEETKRVQERETSRHPPRECRNVQKSRGAGAVGRKEFPKRMHPEAVHSRRTRQVQQVAVVVQERNPETCKKKKRRQRNGAYLQAGREKRGVRTQRDRQERAGERVRREPIPGPGESMTMCSR